MRSSTRWGRPSMLASAAVVTVALTGAAIAPAARLGEGPTAKLGTARTQIAIAVPDQVPPLDPQKRDNIWHRIATDSIYQPLLWRDFNGTLKPVLAAALPKRVNTTTWRFKIRKGVRFTNGEPVNAAAVVASIRRIIDPKFESEWASLIETISGAQARGGYVVDVRTKTPDVLLPARMPIIKIIPPRHSRTANFAARPIGTGPYRWVSGVGTNIVLERNRNYWGARAGFRGGTIDRVLIRAIQDVSTRIAALKAGEVQLITVLPPDAARSVPKRISAPGIENPMVILNTMAGITSDVRVRRALNLAVDKRALASQLFRGFANVSRCQPVAPASIGYDRTLAPYPYNPAEARRQLAAAGATGKTITLVTSNVFTKAREIAQILAAYWTAVGMRVDVKIPEFNTYLDALYAKGANHPDAVYVSSSTDLLDASAAERQLSIGGNQSVYRNAQVDALFRRAQAEPSIVKRAALYKQLLRQACRDAALVNLLHPLDLYGASSRLVWQARFDGRVYFETMTLK